MLVYKVFHAFGKILFCALICDFYFSPSSQRLHKNKKVARSVPFVLIILTPDSSWCCGYWCQYIVHQLDWCLIETHNGFLFV